MVLSCAPLAQPTPSVRRSRAKSLGAGSWEAGGICFVPLRTDLYRLLLFYPLRFFLYRVLQIRTKFNQKPASTDSLQSLHSRRGSVLGTSEIAAGMWVTKEPMLGAAVSTSSPPLTPGYCELPHQTSIHIRACETLSVCAWLRMGAGPMSINDTQLSGDRGLTSPVRWGRMVPVAAQWERNGQLLA